MPAFRTNIPWFDDWEWVGKLWPRHYMPILAVNSILISGALYELIKNKFLYSLSLKKIQ